MVALLPQPVGPMTRMVVEMGNSAGDDAVRGLAVIHNGGHHGKNRSQRLIGRPSRQSISSLSRYTCRCHNTDCLQPVGPMTRMVVEMGNSAAHECIKLKICPGLILRPAQGNACKGFW